MHNVYLFQPQYAVDFREETNYWIPYSAGCLWSYAEQFDLVKQNFRLADLFFSRLDPEVVLSKIDNPKICGFSCYLWNEQYCLAVAEKIRQAWPDCFIVFGGPQVTMATLNHEFIDSVVLSEGEDHFVSILQDIAQGRRPQEVYAKKRLENLDIPSPYLAGTFDRIIAENPNVLWAMTLETNRGCPYQCTFCNWGGVTYSKVKKFDLTRVEAEVEWAIKNPIGYMFVADANFGIFKERDVEIARLIRRIADEGCLEVANITYAKNSTEIIFVIAAILGSLSKGVTVSLQSANEPTLVAIKRKNLDTNNIRHLMQLSKESGISTYTELILGLPNETLESWKTGFDTVLEMGQHDAIEIWPCQVLENSELSFYESRQRYGIKTVTAHDYTPFHNKTDYMKISEVVEIVNATNTMSTQDIVEAYMYGWMIVQLHVIGYTQLYAKYARHVLNIPYREFYDMLFAKLPSHEFFGPMFEHLKTNIEHYMHNGVFIDKNMNGHTMVPNNFKNIYENRAHAYDIGLSTLSEFTKDTAEIDMLQRSFIYGADLDLPKVVEFSRNLDTWESEKSQYQISTKIKIDEQFNFFTTRRNGLLRNILNRV
jgi:radical SAM superfamily enzyme YgiQ (UPF0313 family)